MEKAPAAGDVVSLPEEGGATAHAVGGPGHGDGGEFCVDVGRHGDCLTTQENILELLAQVTGAAASIGVKPVDVVENLLLKDDHR